MKLCVVVISILAQAMALGAYAGEGAGSSGGGDNPAADSGAAWFYMSSPVPGFKPPTDRIYVAPLRTVQICLDVSKKFETEVGTKALKQEIIDSYKEWADYVRQHGVYLNSIVGGPD